MDRRKFLKKAGAGSTALGIAGLAIPHKAGASATESKLPTAILGRTGKHVTRLGVGCGIFIAREFTAQEIASVIETAVDLGVNYIDTAPNYPGVQKKMGPMIKEKRDNIFLVSKVEESTREGVWKQIRKSLKELQTDHLDLVHLHSFGDTKRWSDTEFIIGKDGALSGLLEAKKQGLIGSIGASGHNRPSRYLPLIQTGEIDVLMNVCNYAMQHTYGFEHRVWPVARKQNLGLVAMKVLGGVHPQTQSDFRFDIDEFENALRYSLSVPGVATAVVGMRDPFEVEEAVDVVKKFKPFTETEMKTLSEKGQQLVAESPSLWREAWGPET